MPHYIYTAKNRPNKTIEGGIEAESRQDAINKLTRSGHFPVSIELEDISSLNKGGLLNLRKFSKKDTLLFTRQLSSLIESGVNILKGLNIISNQTQNKYLKAVLNNVISEIRNGEPLSRSLAKHPELFSGLYTSMVHSGEASGNLKESLKRLADYLEKEEEFKNSVRAALTYPLFVLAVGTLTVIVLLTFVIPRLVTMFEDMGQALPLPTKILIEISGAFRSYWWVILVVTAMMVFLLQRFFRTREGKILVSTLKLKLKIVGPITLKTEISRLTRTLSLLLSSGINIVYSLDISASLIENEVLRLKLQEFKDRISTGSSLSHCLSESKLFPELVTSIVAIGEESGNIENSLMRIADDYEKDVDRSLKALSRLLEPAMILFIGLIMGFIVLSMLLPIFQINLIVR